MPPRSSDRRTARREPVTPERQPLIFAHRGSSYAEPEHTLAAYLRAIEEGADGLECDVRLTRDGHVVCVHDRRLNRISNGRGPASMRTLAELDALDFGSWHPGPGERDADVFYDRAESGAYRVLTLDRLLDAVLAAGRPMRLLIETKHPSRYGGVVELRVLQTLRRYGLHEPTPDSPVQASIMSFSALAVRRVRRYAPRLPVVTLLIYLPPGMRGGRLPFGSSIGGPSIWLVRGHPELVHRLHARGHQVYVWTVNEPADLDLVHSLGVAGIITDRPAFARRHLGL